MKRVKDLYPREKIDSMHVTTILEARRAGVKMPPCVIDKKSRRFIDGFHRARAEQRLDGPDAEIEVIEKSYRNEGEMFLDAVRYNASHGRMLNSFDRAHCILLADNLKVDPGVLAGAMSVTVDKIGELRVSKIAKSNGLSVAIKRTIGHMAGKKLSKRQKDVNTKLGGMNQLFYVNQLCMLIESDLIDTENEDLMEGLAKLAELLDKMVGVKT